MSTQRIDSTSLRPLSGRPVTAALAAETVAPVAATTPSMAVDQAARSQGQTSQLALEAPAAAAAPAAKKRGGLFGFLKKVGDGVTEAAKHLVSAAGKVVKGAVQLATSVAVAPLEALGMDGAAKAVRKVGDSVCQTVDAGTRAVNQGLDKLNELNHKVLDKTSELWDKYGNYVIMAAQVACMVVPGLQVVSIGLAVYQAAQAGKMVVDGIKNGDWKAAAMGAVSLVASVAGGAGALGSAVIGKGAMAVAQTATKVANVAKSVVAGAEAIEDKNWGGLVSAAASAVGSGAKLLGEGASAVAQQALHVADRSLSYASKGLQAVQAMKQGDVVGGMASLAALGGYANAELNGNERVTEGLQRTASYLKQGSRVVQGLKTGHLAEAAAAALELGTRAALDLGTDEATMAKLERTTHQVELGLNTVASLRNGQLGRAVEAIGTLASEQGWLEADEAARATELVRQGEQVVRAARQGKFLTAARDLTQLAGESRLLKPAARSKVEARLDEVERLQQDLRGGNLRQAIEHLEDWRRPEPTVQHQHLQLLAELA